MIRDMNLNDLVKLESYALFPMEFLTNKPMIIQKSFEDDKGLIGSFVITATAEMTAIFNGRSDRDKVKALLTPGLVESIYRELYSRGYRDLHMFIRNPGFADIMIKHFGFEDVVGRALVRRA